MSDLPSPAIDEDTTSSWIECSASRNWRLVRRWRKLSAETDCGPSSTKSGMSLPRPPAGIAASTGSRPSSWRSSIVRTAWSRSLSSTASTRPASAPMAV